MELSISRDLENPARRVFISHGKHSHDLANRLSSYLNEHSCEAVLFKPTVDTGQDARKAVFDALARVDGVILIVDAEPSDWERFEWSAALQTCWNRESKRLVPILVGDAEEPPFLRAMASLRLPSELPASEEKAFSRIIELLDREVSAEKPTKETQSQLLERLDVAIGALSQEEFDEEALHDHRQTLEQALAAAPDLKAEAMLRLGIGLIGLRLGKPEEALEPLQRALEICDEGGAPDYPSRVAVQVPLAQALAETGHLDEAVNSLRASIAIRERQENDELGLLASQQELGVLLTRAGRLAEGKEVFEGILQPYRREFGDDHPRVRGTELWLAVVHERLGDAEGARRYYERVVAVRDPEDSPSARAMHFIGLGRALTELGEFEAAREALTQAVALAESDPSTDANMIGAAAFALGVALLRASQPENAVQAFEKAVQRNSDAQNYEGAVASKFFLGRACRYAGDLARAQQVLNEAVQSLQSEGRPGHRRQAEALYELGLVARDREDLSEAKRLFESAIELGREVLGESDPRVARYRRAAERLDQRSLDR